MDTESKLNVQLKYKAINIQYCFVISDINIFKHTEELKKTSKK